MPNNGLEKDLEYLKLEFLTYQNLKKKNELFHIYVTSLPELDTMFVNSRGGVGNSIVFHLSFLTHSACQYDVT